MAILEGMSSVFEKPNGRREALTSQQAEGWLPLCTRQRKYVLKETEVLYGAVQWEDHFGHVPVLQAQLYFQVRHNNDIQYIYTCVYI